MIKILQCLRRIRYKKLVCSSRVKELYNAAKSFRQLLYKRDRECSLKIDAECVIIATFRH